MAKACQNMHGVKKMDSGSSSPLLLRTQAHQVKLNDEGCQPGCLSITMAMLGRVPLGTRVAGRERAVALRPSLHHGNRRGIDLT